MPAQLDILALEPFYGGARRSMLETVVRHSRHRWTVFKLPPRRLERRLSVAATWFAEQLKAHWVGRADVVFTSEAMNLHALFRAMPDLAKKPSVVYFHSNQLPDVNSTEQRPLDLVNLNTASAAGEIWFNSDFHFQDFLVRAAGLIERHRELAAQDPLVGLARRARVMPPPVDLSTVQHFRTQRIERDPTALFVETRDADLALLNKALHSLKRGGESFRLITVGPLDGLDSDAPRTALAETDELGHARAMYEAGMVVSAKPSAPCDFLVVRALAAGCRPVLPRGGVYPEILPRALHDGCLYDVSPESLAGQIEIGLSPFRTDWNGDGLGAALQPFDVIPACKKFDDRLDQLAAVDSPAK